MQANSIQSDQNVSLAIHLGYNGAAYSGFAKQKDPSISTVQGELEKALSILLRREVQTVCAGRTDAGVHARGQVVSCVVDASELDGKRQSSFLRSINALTPVDVVATGVHVAPADFSARFDAVKREYRYRIVTGPAQPVFLRDFAWWHAGSLAPEPMREAAKHLVGEHDFKSFCKAASAQGKSTVREIELIELFEEEQMGETCLCIRIVGNAFLHSMVRTIVGTLAQVGSGRRDPEWVAQVLAARERGAAGECAPAKGLVFWHVSYPDGLFKDSLAELV